MERFTLASTGIAPPSVRNTAIQSQGFFPPTSITRTNSDANYNALQVKVNKQFSRGLQLGVAYTWSPAIDDSNDPLIPEVGEGSFPIDARNPTSPIREIRTMTSAIAR